MPQNSTTQSLRAAQCPTRPVFAWLAAALLLTPCVAAATAAPRVEVDPMVAEVPAPPPLVDSFEPAVYAKMYAHALHATGPAPAADAPTTAVRVTRVEAGSPAAGVKLHAGDLIVAIDAKPTPTADAARAARRAATGPTTFDVLPLDGSAHRAVDLPPGHLGVDIDDAWLAGNQYARDLPAGTTPLDEVRVAARYATINPPLAIAALAHAKQAGAAADAAVVDAIAAFALFNDNDYEGALAYATAAAKRLPDEQRARLNEVVAYSALATFRYPIADAIAKKDKRLAKVLAATTAAELDRVGAKNPTEPQPNPSAAQVAFTDRTKEATNLSRHVNGEFESTEWSLGYLTHKDMFPFRTPDGTYTVVNCGPGGANVDFSADCHFAPSDEGRSGFVKVVRIGVHGDTVPGKMLELYVDGAADVIDEVGEPNAKFNLSRLVGGDRTFNVHLCIVGDRYEFDIDGKRIFYGPVSAGLPVDTRQLTLSIQTVGVGGTFTNVKWQTAPAK